MLESAIQKKIVDFLEDSGALVYKTISLSKSGFPDIMGVYKGRHIHIEVKQPGKKATKLQEFKMNKLTIAGSYGCVATSVGDARKLLVALDAQPSLV